MTNDNAPVRCRNGRITVYLGWLLALLSLTPAARAQYHFDAWTTSDGLPHNSVTGLRQTRDGYLWMTTPDGVARFDGVRFTVFNKSNTPSLLSNRFSYFTLWEDRQGALWMGTEDAGLVRYRDGNFTAFTTGDGLPNNHVITLYQHPRGPEWSSLRPLLQDRTGQVWGSGIGLTRLREGWFENIFRASNAYAPENIVNALYEDRDGALWVGTQRGLARFKEGRWREEQGLSARIRGGIFAIRRDRRGDLWLGGVGGLYRLHGEELTHYTAADGMPEATVYAIEEGRDGTLWIATDAGLLRTVSGRFRALTTADGLSFNRVAALYEDAESTLWIGTYDGGLNRLKGGRIVSYTTEHGLYSNGVFQILEDDFGFFWIGSNRGLHRVRKQELNDFADGKISALTATHFDQRDGLVNPDCDSLGEPPGFKARDGKLWFPTNNGVPVVEPAVVRFNPDPPPVVIEEATLDRKPVDFRRGLRIGPGQENLEIHFTSLSLIKSEQLHFRYKMEGLDHGWVEAGTRPGRAADFRQGHLSHRPSRRGFFQRGARTRGERLCAERQRRDGHRGVYPGRRRRAELRQPRPDCLSLPAKIART